MDGETQTQQLITQQVMPELGKISEKLETLLTAHAELKTDLKHQKSLTRDNFSRLPCAENRTAIDALEKQVLVLTERAKNGHELDRECRDKNSEVAALKARVETNEKKNAEQEARYQKLQTRVWMVVGTALASSLGLWLYDTIFKTAG